jgi:hypothetical protein
MGLLSRHTETTTKPIKIVKHSEEKKLVVLTDDRRGIRFSVDRITSFLFILVSFFFVVDLFLIALKATLGDLNKLTIAVGTYFDLAGEVNLPAFFSSVLLLIASVLLYTNFRLVKRFSRERKYWLLLSMIFAYLAIDEFCQVHEHLNKSIYKLFRANPDGMLVYGWIVPYGAMFIGVSVFCWRFVNRLPARIRNLFMISGAMYVTAAIAFKIIEVHIERLQGIVSVPYLLLCGFKEILEMSAVVLFIHALLLHTVSKSPRIVLAESASPE